MAKCKSHISLGVPDAERAGAFQADKFIPCALPFSFLVAKLIVRIRDARSVVWTGYYRLA
jgi:hypothetical protein